MRKRYLGIYSHGKFNFMDEKEALCTEHRAYCDVCVKNNVLMVDMTVPEVNISSLYVIAIVSRGCRELTQVNSEIPFNANNQDGKMSEGQMGESCKSFTPPTTLNNRGEALDFIRPLNDGRTMHNDQNGLTVMSSRSSINEKSKVKPETKCNQIQNKLWQKQSNRNISTCVAQREVA